jgi:uncharacterized protein
MVDRTLIPTKSNSFFLFGPRGSGKTTLLKRLFTPEEAMFIDLLDPVDEDLFLREPVELERRARIVKGVKKWIVIDEIQKLPRLLDTVHRLIENDGFYCALTGSSARKLKRGASNLLAGRAFVYNLHPFTHRELGERFDLNHALNWGTLPKMLEYVENDDKRRFLQAYSLTYLKEEVVAEQLVRNLHPFRAFLEVAAQMNGRIINYSRIADEVGVDTKTVQSYFSILEDTLVGFILPAFHRSIRKQQRAAPKFYFFDIGVRRALQRTTGSKITEGTYGYGEAFEHFIFLEMVRLNHYRNMEWNFSYLQTKDGAEIDLVIDRPGLPIALVEIKSTTHVTHREVSTLNRFIKDLSPCDAFCLSRDPHEKMIDSVRCLHWEKGIRELGL